MWVRSPLEEMKYLLEFGRKWGTECLNTRPTLLCARYSVKLKKKLRPICTLEIWEHYLLNCRVTYTLILNEKGGVEADLTVTILDGGSGPLHEPIFKVRLPLVFYIYIESRSIFLHNYFKVIINNQPFCLIFWNYYFVFQYIFTMETRDSRSFF